MLDRRLFLYSGLAATALATPDPAAENEVWRRERLARLKGEEGWLTVAGLHWLEPGVNGIPAAPGLLFTRKGDSVLLESSRPVLVNGKPTQKRALKKDTDKITIGERTFFVIVRGDRVAIRERDKQSNYRTHFKGLQLYPFRPELRCLAKWIPYSKTAEAPHNNSRQHG